MRAGSSLTGSRPAPRSRGAGVSFMVVAGLLLCALVAALSSGRGAPDPSALPSSPAARRTALKVPTRSDAMPARAQAAPQQSQPQRQSRLFARNGRESDLQGLSVARYLEPRLRAARLGDTRAGYEAYQALSLCARLDESGPDAADQEEHEAWQREQRQIQRLCEGVSPAQVRERQLFLTQAAAAGHVGAQIDFFVEGPPGAAGSDPADPALRQWQAQALGFLRSAAGRCDAFALGQLSTVYRAGLLGEPDAQQALVYGLAASALRHRSLDNAQLRARYGELLSDDQLDAARQTAAQLVQSSC